MTNSKLLYIIQVLILAKSVRYYKLSPLAGVKQDFLVQQQVLHNLYHWKPGPQ